MQFLRLDAVSDGLNDPAIKEYYIGPGFRGTLPDPKLIKLFRDILRCTEAEHVFDWWLTLVKDGNPPKKSDIKMQDIAQFAQNIGLVICTEEKKMQFRLAGHGIEDLVGKPLTGLDLSALSPQSIDLCKIAWKTQVKQRRLRYYRRDLRHLGREYRNVGILELPISDGDDGRFQYILSHVVTLPLNL